MIIHYHERPRHEGKNSSHIARNGGGSCDSRSFVVASQASSGTLCCPDSPTLAGGLVFRLNRLVRRFLCSRFLDCDGRRGWTIYIQAQR